MVLVYLTCLHWFKRHSELDQVKWDMLTITPGDYTMQMEITEKMYAYFIKNIYARQSERPVAVVLKEYLRKHLEETFNQMLQEMKSSKKDKLMEQDDEAGEEGHLNIDEVKIADIVFAFNNDVLIKLLKQRGLLIMNQKYEEAAKIEKQIQDFKDNNYDHLVRPVDAFITFEEEDGKIVAEEYEKKYNKWGKQLPALKEFLGDDLFLVEATEPTNIIWENRHFTEVDTFRRSLRAFAAIVCLLIASFLTIYYFKSIAINTSRMYPSIQPAEIVSLY